MTKEKPKIDLNKKSDIDIIKVNLNWNISDQSNGFFSNIFKSSSKKIDLDLGAYIKTINGEKFLIQALGRNFGNFNRKPFLKLLGDDRTGAVKDGEWIHINGKKIDQIREIVIYTFIYEGVPNWQKTDGIVKIYVPYEPIIETYLTEGNDLMNMCAIARIINNNNNISVERINRYFRGHEEMDLAFGWGFRWQSARK